MTFSSTPYKNGRLPKGDQFLQDVGQDKIRRMIAQTPSGKARDMPVACCKRKDGMSLHAISSAMMRSYSTVRGWLVRLLQYGLDGRFDKKSTGRKRILGEHAVGMIRNWLYEDPSEFGFASASWSLGMVRDVIRSRICAFGCIRTLQRVLRRIRFSYTKPRPAPRKSATTEEQEQFKEKTKRTILGVISRGYAVLAGDEAGVQLGASAGYGWRPTGAETR